MDFGRIADLAKALRNVYVYDGCYSKFRKRRHGRPAAHLHASHFLGYLQTHDQVGNRANGERIAQITTLARAKTGAALVLCGPFVPMLFQGEEFAAKSPFLYFTNHAEPEIAEGVASGRIREFEAFGWHHPPNPQDPATFWRSKLDWTELEQAPHREMHDWYRRLIALRQATPALTQET